MVESVDNKASTDANIDENVEEVAVIGMAGRFPGASDIDAFWRNLKAGVSTLTRFADEELARAGTDPELLANPAYVKARPVLENVDLFDASFFGITPKDAEVMDPQHRLFLECSWEALERAGYNSETYDGAIGIFAGQSLNTYLLANLCPDRSSVEDLVGAYQVGAYPTVLGNDKDYLTTRISYKLNLRGPGVTVQCACSTSLVAICQAAQSLLNYQCDMSLAGGVSITFPQTRGYLYQEGGMVSPDGVCRTFDAGAEGTVFGSGVGVVLLKRLSDAIADRDTILAVIKGYGLNNDGARKVSYMAPSVDGQAEAITAAHAMAGVPAESISYIETHGTGTPLGDPIEVAGLEKAFRDSTDKIGFCALGSVKTNVGHLEVAAGVTGFIKTVLALSNRQLPPSLHYTTPNPAIDFANSPFYVNDTLAEWTAGPFPRRAGVSAFGVGGTNAHVILEEAPPQTPSSRQSVCRALVLSAKTATALNEATSNLSEHLRHNPEVDMDDAAYTLQLGRRHFEHRRVVVCLGRDDALCALDSLDAKRVFSAVSASAGRGAACLFPGQGAQSVGMAADLYDTDSGFRRQIDYYSTLLKAEMGLDIRTVLYPKDEERESALQLLHQTSITQPTLFAIEYALARWWQENGVQPKAMLGHSVGEYVAACIAGVFTVEDALKLLAARGTLIQGLPGGTMLAVRRSEAEVQGLLGPDVCLAAVNSPTATVLSGTHEAISEVQKRLAEEGVASRSLKTSHAFHSSMLDPVLDEFEALVRSVGLHAPQIPYISNVSGTWITAGEATDPRYWVRHLRETVRFAQGVQELLSDPGLALVEVGPGKILSTLARQQGSRAPDPPVFASLGLAESREPDLVSLTCTLGKLWLAGVEPDWKAAYAGTERRRIPLPTYPFERKRFWRDPVPSSRFAPPFGPDGEIPVTRIYDRRRVGGALIHAPLRIVDTNTREFEYSQPAEANMLSLLPDQEIKMGFAGTVPDHIAEVAPSSSQNQLVQVLKSLLQEASGSDLTEVDSSASFLEMGFDSLFLTQACLIFQREFKLKITFRQLMGDLSNFGDLAAHIELAAQPEVLAKLSAIARIADEARLQAAHLQAPARSVLSTVNGAPVVGIGGSAVRIPSSREPIAAAARELQINTLFSTMGSDGQTGGNSSLPASSAPDDATVSIVQQQLNIMARQLELLGMPGAATPAVTRPVAASALAENVVEPVAVKDAPEPKAKSAEQSKADRELVDFKAFGPYRPINKCRGGALTATEQDFLDGFIARFTRRTAESKRLAQSHRDHHADPRAVSGFRAEWKEMVYPISVERSSGSKLWDVDGNEYIDMLNGFGVTMFGHSPRFVTEAVERQLKLGVEIGPQTPLAGRAAELICELTGMDRACFCNTGSEAVMAALRLARTVTGRDKVVLFTGSYHGTFDEVLVRANPSAAKLSALPIAPGIPPANVANVIVLEYGDPDSLAILKSHAHDLAAVLVETVQSRHPDLQPREFLREVRSITRDSGTALIFDEVVTGFRVHPGGVQALFGIRADMATYGKVIGGGFPVGVLAGRKVFMDALDGGAWRYGDDSFPEVGVTFHAGTFVRHPLAMAAVWAVLNHLKTAGPQLQEGLNKRAAQFAETLNAHFEAFGVPTRIRNFGSVLYFKFPTDLRFSSLLYYALRYRGVHIYEGFPFFLTTAHTDSDLDYVIGAFKEAISEMQQAGFLPPPPEQADEPRAHRIGHDLSPTTAPAAPEAVAPVAPRVSCAPLTEAQREIWLSAQMSDEASCAYNESCSVHLRGPLNMDALRGAIQELVRRHDALRTTFGADGGIQEFAAELSLDVPLIDMTEAEDRLDRERMLIANEAEKPFDLVNGPAVRIQVLKLARETYHLLFTAHHIVCDGWSIGVLLNELSRLYSSAVLGTVSASETPMQFGEYAMLQEQERDSSERTTAESYWKERFREPVPILDLPTDRPRPARKSFNGSMERATLDADLLTRIKHVGAKHGSTLFSTLLAAINALVFRLSGERDLVIGIPAAGQSMVGCPSLVGHCLNFLPIRCRVENSAPFAELAAGVKNQVLDAYDHQDYTFGTLVRALNLPRDPSRLPLLNLMFNIDPDGLDRLPFAGLEAEVVNNAKRYTNMDLFLNIYKKGDGLCLECDYNTDLFDRLTVQRWLSQYLMLLESAVTDPSRSIDALDILTPNERRTLLVDWNDTQAEYPKDAAVHTLVEEQARRTPEAVAVVFGDQKLTYRELDCKADALAKRLQTLGVAPEVRVALFVERSLDMVIGMLGIAKAGGAYVPLDPDYPAKRIEYILADARAPVIVTQAHLAQRLAEAGQPPAPCRTVLIDRELPQTTDQPATAGMDKEAAHPFATSGMADCTTDRLSVGTVDGAPSPAHPLTHSPAQAFAPSPAQAENLAYVIYTSGSTGNPKGVQITHRALVNLLCSMRLEPGLSAADSLAAVTTLCFDIAGLELWLPLITGARIVIVGREVAVDGERLAALLERERVTVMQATPATWRLLLEAGWKGSPALKILCGGEAFPRSLAQALLPRCASLWNVYGPTETTIWSTALHIVDAEKPMSIGHPIANTQVYILDANQNPQPIGVPGELYIGGDGLARGYLNLPELTAEKFVPFPPTLAADASANRAAQPAANPKSVAVSTGIDNPKSGRPGEAIQNPKSAEPRLYRTGDLARRLADGTIEFLGRLDNQVKIRGFRIELGEIETVLKESLLIEDSVTAVGNDHTGEPSLIAFIVPKKEEGATWGVAGQQSLIERLAAVLKSRLPDYMRPNAFVFLDKLPLTPNGKIDRKALKAPAEGVKLSKASFAAPTTMHERLLTGIWSEVLHIDRIGIEDDFFNLGGNSMHVLQIASRAVKAGLNLTARDIFAHRSVSEILRAIGSASAERTASAVPPLTRTDRRPVTGADAGRRSN